MINTKAIRVSILGELHASKRSEALKLIETRIPLRVLDSCPSSIDGLFVDFILEGRIGTEEVRDACREMISAVAKIYQDTILGHSGAIVTLEASIRASEPDEDAGIFRQELSLSRANTFLDNLIAASPEVM